MSTRKGGIRKFPTDPDHAGVTRKPDARPDAELGFPCKLQIPLTLRDGRKGAVLVDMTGEGMALTADGTGLALVIRAPVLGVDPVIAEALSEIEGGADVPGVVRPPAGGGTS